MSNQKSIYSIDDVVASIEPEHVINKIKVLNQTNILGLSKRNTLHIKPEEQKLVAVAKIAPLASKPKVSVSRMNTSNFS